MERKYKRISILLLFILMLLTMLQQMAYYNLGGLIATLNGKYHLLTILWGAMILSMIFFVPRVHILGKSTYKERMYFDAMIFAIIIIACQYILGFITINLGNSPYDLSMRGIFNNTLNRLPLLIARELVRAYLINTYCQKKNRVLFYLISFLFILCDFNYNSIRAITNQEELLSFVSKTIGPAVCKSILLSYMALYGGAAVNVVFILISFVFQWMFPVLPILNWLSEAVIGIIVPIFEVTVLVKRYKPLERIHKDFNLRDIISMSITLSISVLLLWFVVGVFPIYPSVIATGSMEPLIYPGDVILIDKVQENADIDRLKEGDIIQFSRETILITHRIVGVEEDKEGNTQFVTKGDNNSSEDIQKVIPEDIKGTLVQIIPKIGYPTLWIKEKEKIDIEELEF